MTGWKSSAVVGVIGVLLSGCWVEQDETAVAPPVRGLITTLVEEIQETTVRRYPGVLEPGEVNVLSFEVGGRLGRLALDVGQRVAQDELLATLDAEQFETQIDNRQAAVEEAEATLAQAEADLARSQQLLDRGVGTVVTRDEDRTAVMQSRAQLTQAEKDLASARQDFADSKLYAPFDGIIDAVEADSFATVSAGETIVTLYEQTGYEVSFSVSFDVVSRLVVGTRGTVRLADNPEIVLKAVVSELGERADTVSSFPVIVRLDETNSLIKAGMAVEVAFEFTLPADRGHLIPISAAIPDLEVPEGTTPGSVVEFEVFVFDPATQTVRRRCVTTAGIRENQFLIIDGLVPGERVATKGVTFLREGMEVRLLPDPPGD